MKSEEILEKRYRNFMLLLYPEWDNYKDLLFDIKGSFKNYAYLEHQKEASEKKDHLHLILSLDNPRSIESLSKRLDLKKQFIQPIKSLRASCRYLIHKDNEDKIQYNLFDVVVSNSFKSKFFGAFDDLKSDDDMLKDIYDFIKDYIGIYNAIDLEVKLTQFVLANGYDKIFKRYYQTISKYIAFYSKF